VDPDPDLDPDSDLDPQNFIPDKILT